MWAACTCIWSIEGYTTVKLTGPGYCLGQTSVTLFLLEATASAQCRMPQPRKVVADVSLQESRTVSLGLPKARPVKDLQ